MCQDGWEFGNRPGADGASLLPQDRAGFSLYRKLKQEDVANGQFRAFIGKEILDRTSQVSVLLKNLGDKPIAYDLYAFRLNQEGAIVVGDPSRFLPGTPAQPMAGTLGPGQYAYLVIGCPEFDLTLPVTLTYNSGNELGFSITL